MSEQRKIQTIGVIGSGRMGTDIFLFLDGHGYTLRWLCKGETERDAAGACFRKRVMRQKKTGLLSEEAFTKKINNTLIGCEPDLLNDCDLIIESIPEHSEEKRNIFARIIQSIDQDCIITSNSSSIKPSQLVTDKQVMKRFAGMHFFYPLALKTSVELIHTADTTAETLASLRAFLADTGRNVFELDEPNAFMLNRIFLPVQAEACRLAASGIMDYRQIDSLVQQYIFPCGIFSLFDQIGNDIMLESVKNYAAFEPDPGFLEPILDILAQKVSDNALGIKTGQGFYNYNEPGQENPSIDMADENTQICLSLLDNTYKEAALTMWRQTNTDVHKLNEALMEYTGADKGPLSVIS